MIIPSEITMFVCWDWRVTSQAASKSLTLGRKKASKLVTSPQTKCMSTIFTSHLRHNEIKMLQEVKYLVTTPWSLLLHLNLSIVYIIHGQVQTSVTTVNLIWWVNINKIQGRISHSLRCILLKVLTFISPVAPESKVFLEQFSANVITYHTLSLLPALPQSSNGTNMLLPITKSRAPGVNSRPRVSSVRVFSAKKGQV